MRIFLCWSGERSRHVAAALEEFLVELNTRLPAQLPSAFVPFRSANIEKGLLWFQAVESQLASADAALLSITPENCDSPWIHYEAGAIANRMSLAPGNGHSKADALKSRLFTYLFGMEARDLNGPLAAYQSTVATYEDTRALVQQLLGFGVNGATGTVVQSSPGLTWNEEGFLQCWRNFAANLRSRRTQPFSDVVEGFEQKFRRLTFEEPIAQCHRQAWTDRINGCHEVLTDLRLHVEKVKERCRPYEAELYRQLLTALNGYEMTMHAYLVTERRFQLGESGTLMIPKVVKDVCEDRRHAVLDAIAALLDPGRAPVFDESPAFARLETFGEKKNTIHRKGAAIREWMKQRKGDIGDATQLTCREGGTGLTLSQSNMSQWNVPPVLPNRAEFEGASLSDWDFDRVVYYLAHSECLRQGLPVEIAKERGILTGKELERKVVDCLQSEIEKIRAGHRAERTVVLQGKSTSSDATTAALPKVNPQQSAIAETRSRIALSYALRVLEDLITQRPVRTGDVTLGLEPSMAEEFINVLESIVDLEQGLVSQVGPRAESLLRKLKKGIAAAA